MLQSIEVLECLESLGKGGAREGRTEDKKSSMYGKFVGNGFLFKGEKKGVPPGQISSSRAFQSASGADVVCGWWLPSLALFDGDSPIDIS